MAESRVITAIREFREGLLSGEAAMQLEMARRWLTVEASLQGQIDALCEEAARLGISGEEVWRLQRSRALQAQILAEMRGYEGYADEVIQRLQERMLQQGIDDAAMLTRLATEDGGFTSAGITARWNRLPIEAVQSLVGICKDGAPLFDVLQRRALGPWAVEGLRDALVKGTALGWNPRKTAARMRDGLSEGLNKAMQIARSEQLRAYRHASDEQYRSSGVVQSKVRIAAKQGRTCLACLAMDGEIIPLGEEMYDHVRGRCVAAPVVYGMDMPQWEKGADWFAKLDPEQQRGMMGGARFEAWQEGRFDFRQLAVQTQDDTWGRGLRVRPLRELVSEAA